MLKQNVNQKKQQIPSLRRRLLRGFSLIELLVVVSIIALIAGLLSVWMIGARKQGRINNTHSVMGGLLVVADVLKTQCPVKPDHRLANFYWVDTNLASATAPNPATSRQMSSAEFLAFLASTNAVTDKQMHIFSSSLQSTSVGNTTPDGQGVPALQVLVFEQAPNFETPIAKAAAIQASDPNYLNRPYQLVCSRQGWPLQTICDSWGHEMLYRFYTDATELNAVANTSEDIIGDEQPASPVIYKATATAAWGAGVSSRPAVAAYGFPSIISAGPDGRWGTLKDLTPPNVAPNYTRDACTPDKRAARDLDAMDNLYSQESDNR